MKAWVLQNVGTFEYKEKDLPEICEGEVLIKVEACGICGSDIPRIYRDGAHVMPLVPGHEFAGTVMHAQDTSLVGKRVGVYPLIPCFKCSACKKGRHEMCKSYSYLGSRRDGGFADYVAVPEKNLIELPDNVSFLQAAMLEPMAVAVHAIRRLKIKKEDRIMVCGLGTIGMLIVMLLKSMGYSNIFVRGNKEFQKKTVCELGILEENYNSEIDTVDVFFECVGKNETVSLAVDMTSAGGSICMVGNPASDMIFDKNTYWKILRNQLNVTGTWNSSFFDKGVFKESDWEYVVNTLSEGKIAPEKLISHTFDMKEINKGMEIMRDKSEDYLKIIGR